MRLRPLALAICTILVCGCAPNHDATEKGLADLRAEVGRLRARQEALGERLDTLEISRGVQAKPGEVATAESVRTASADHAQLDVVHLSPSEGDGDADVDGGRPVVRAAGAEGSRSHQGRRKSQSCCEAATSRNQEPRQPQRQRARLATSTLRSTHENSNPADGFVGFRRLPSHCPGWSGPKAHLRPPPEAMKMLRLRRPRRPPPAARRRPCRSPSLQRRPTQEHYLPLGGIPTRTCRQAPSP